MEIEGLKVGTFFDFLWFWGMVFSGALTATWLDSFLVAVPFEYLEIEVKNLCAGQGFSQKKVPKLAFRTYFQNITIAKGNFTGP